MIGYEGADRGFLCDLEVVLARVVEAERQVSVGMCPALTLAGSVANTDSAIHHRPYRRGVASGGYPAACEPGGARGADPPIRFGNGWRIWGRTGRWEQ